MNKEKKLIRITVARFVDFDNLTLKQAKELIEEYNNLCPEGTVPKLFDNFTGQGSNYGISFERLETEEELNYRMSLEQAAAAMQECKDMREYDRLKKKYSFN